MYRGRRVTKSWRLKAAITSRGSTAKKVRPNRSPEGEYNARPDLGGKQPRWTFWSDLLITCLLSWCWIFDNYKHREASWISLISYRWCDTQICKHRMTGVNGRFEYPQYGLYLVEPRTFRGVSASASAFSGQARQATVCVNCRLQIAALFKHSRQCIL